MKKTILFSLLTILFFTISCSKEEAPSNTDCNLVNPSATVNDSEVELIKQMREEEKLAHDVYLYLYEKYRINIFNNIAQSEKTHMNQVLCLMDYYNIPDVASTEFGVFQNATLQQIYNELIIQGNISVIEALKVGATIEDLDIKDLMDFMEETQNQAILNTFESLNCGSRNHMRAFNSNLLNLGETYSPQFISTELYNEIILTSKERCN